RASAAKNKVGTWLRKAPATSSRNGEVASSSSVSNAVGRSYWRRTAHTTSNTVAVASTGSTSHGTATRSPIASTAAVPGGYCANQRPSSDTINGFGKAFGTGGTGAHSVPLANIFAWNE